MPTEVIFHHGWGFDSTMWDGWVDAFAKDGAVCLSAERGYFGLPKENPQFSDDADFKIVVAHSLGLHFISESELEQCDALLILAGFLNFHPTEQLARKRSQRVIRAMKEKLTKDPAALINDFWANCYAPELTKVKFLPVETMHINLLLEDLQVLDQNEIPASRFAKVPQVVSVASTTDHILHQSTADQMADISPNTTLIKVPDLSHAFPLTSALDCASLFNYCRTRDQKEACHQ